MQATQLRDHTQAKTKGTRERISSVRSTTKRQNNGTQSLLETKYLSETDSLSKHSDRKRANRYIARRYEKCGFTRKAEKLRKCHSKIHRDRCQCGQYERYYGTNSCNSRLCPICSRRKSEIKSRGYGAVIRSDFEQGKFNYSYHLVLTYRNTEHLTGDYIKDMRTFRSRLSKQTAVYGGLQSLEIKKGRNGKFNVHWHVLLLTNEHLAETSTGRVMLYVRQRIADLWESVAGKGNRVIEIKPFDVSDIHELTKYVTKVQDIEAMSDGMFTELTRFIEGKRLFSPFGKLYNRRADIDALQDESVDECCPHCGSTDLIHESFIYRPSKGVFVKNGAMVFHARFEVQRE